MPLLPPSFIPYSSPRHDDEVQREQAAQLAPPPPMCLTGVMCEESTMSVSRVLENGTVWFTVRILVFRPRLLHYDEKIHKQPPPPLVVLHGGPSVPSNYLHPLVHLVTDRAIVYYDQLGCGRSSRPTDLAAYSIELCKRDLIQLIHQKLNLNEFHLYGHSFGGILAFEYLKDNTTNEEESQHKCLSLILSSTPSSIPLVEEESKRLLETIIDENQDSHEDTDDDEQNDEEECHDRRALEVFRQTHECRVVPIPLPLLDAYAQAGTIWRGTKAISDYVATCTNDSCSTFPPSLVLRGQYDFVTPKCTKGWTQLLKGNCQTMVLAGCSHYGLLENENLYGDVVVSFIVQHDPIDDEEHQHQQAESTLEHQDYQEEEESTSEQDEEE